MSRDSNRAPPEASVLWRRIDEPGHDACGLWHVANGWRLHGSAVFALHGERCLLEYDAQCDASWRARSASVAGWIGRRHVALEIAADTEGTWYLNSDAQPAVAGCIDVDLNFTPATNLIAIRRLALRVGERADAPAAWLRFPELRLERLEQEYRRIDSEQYGYAAPDVGYSGVLRVLPVGFVTLYPGLWELEAVEGQGGEGVKSEG
jgi:uncharacterized protein